MNQAELLAYARELDRQTVLVKAILEGRAAPRAALALKLGSIKLERKLDAALAVKESE